MNPLHFCRQDCHKNHQISAKSFFSIPLFSSLDFQLPAQPAAALKPALRKFVSFLPLSPILLSYGYSSSALTLASFIIKVSQQYSALPSIAQHSQHYSKFSLYRRRRNEQHFQSCFYLFFKQFIMDELRKSSLAECTGCLISFKTPYSA